MDSYDLFGDDGSGMLEGLADLGSDNFDQSTAPVTGATRDAPNPPSYTPTSYAQPVPQETPLQKLSSFGAADYPAPGHMEGGWEGNAPGRGYGGGRPQQRPSAPQYPPQQYHPTPDAMYGLAPDQQNIGLTEMGGWAGGPPSIRGYPPPGGYRHPHPYDHQKMHYSQQQMGLQGVGGGPGPGGYMQRQPHYPTQQHMYSQQHPQHQQAYQGYAPMHQQGAGRLGQHMTYHQMDMGPHQYSHMHQGLPPHQGGLPPQSPHPGQPHQSVPSHPNQTIPQSHPSQLQNVPGHANQPPHQSLSGHPNQLHQNVPGHAGQPHPGVQPVHPNQPHQTPSSGHPGQNVSNIPNQSIHMGQNVPNHPNSGVNHPNQLQSVPPHPNVPTHPNQSLQAHPPNMSGVPPSQVIASHQNQGHPNLHGGAVPNHPNQALQNVSSHPSMQGHVNQSHQNVHPSHANSAGHPPPQQQMVHMGPYSQNSPHSVPVPSMGYNQHPMQRSLDINVNTGNQYPAGKTLTSLDGSSPQYRAPFPQLSPQMSPRAQMSPRPQTSQMSPRPVMSPAKPPNMSPHPHMQNTLSPRPPAVSKTSSPIPTATYSQQSTLQALEQMVLPNSVNSNDYNYQGLRNPLSPAIGPRMPASPQQWQHSSHRSAHSINGAASSDLVSHNSNLTSHATPIFNKPPEEIPSTETSLNVPVKEVSVEQPVLTSLPPSEVSPCVKTTDDSKSEPYDPTKIVECNPASSTTDSEIISEKPKTPEPAVVSNEVENDKEESFKPDTETSLVPVSDNETPNTQFTNAINDKPLIAETIDEKYTPEAAAIDTNVTNTNIIGRVASPVALLQHGQPPNISIPPQLGPTSQLLTNMGIQNGQPAVQQPGISLPQQINVSSSNMPPIANMPPNITPLNIPTNQIQPLIPCSTIPPNTLQMPPQVQMNPTMQPGPPMHANMQGHLGMPPNISQIGMPPQGQYDGTNPMIGNMGMGPRGPLCPMAPGVMPMLGPGIIPHPNMTNMYQPPINHHQERAALQQQIQEIFCMPPSPENQDKVMRLQERLNILQQHETNDKCTGGPQCILQNPMYGSAMIDSPQVSSTTGRGRTKGPAKPRKPRTKKSDKLSPITHNPENLPVSEDCVTPGTGLKSITDIGDFRGSNELLSLDNSIISSDIDGMDPKLGKRIGRKPREKKSKEPKIPKERKKREPKDPNAPKKRRMSKKKGDNGSDYDSPMMHNPDLQSNLSSEGNTGGDNTKSLDMPLSSNQSSLMDEPGVTDFDDIPVSKIPIKELLEEAAAAKRERDESVYDLDDEVYSNSVTPTKKKGSAGKRSKVLAAGSVKKGKRLPGARRKKRGGIVPESDGEPDDLITTPPPSPPPEGDCDSSKRRSARHTQRKKYTDDVLLRLSDEEFPEVSTSKSDKDTKPKESVKEQPVVDVETDDKGDIVSKPNYIYINTTDEDSMIVQFVLASRMGKREMIPEPPKPIIEIKKEDDDSTTADDIKPEEKADTDGNEDKPSENAEDKDTTELLDNKLDSAEGSDDSPDVNLDVKADDMKDNTLDTVESEIANVKSPTIEPVKAEITEPTSDETVEDKLESTESQNTICENPTVSKPSVPATENGVPVMVDVEEYFVKYRNFSHLHCEWKTEDELYKGDKRVYAKIKRFKQKQSQQLNIFEYLDEEPFNPDYVEVERILDVSEHVDPATSECAKHYLVKWKSLPYEDSTWELEEDIDPLKIRLFETFKDVPSKDKWRFKKRPPPEQWMQLDESPLYKGGNTLRNYQLEGLNWLLFSWFNGRNCILADEMGLGKTIQSLTFINAVWELGIRGPFLVIAPLSTIPNWQRELEGWTDMNVVVYHGSQQSKVMIQEYELFYKNDKGNFIKEITKFNVLITTFEVIVTDFQDLKLFNWRLCIIDEAHRLKNRNCKLLEGLRQLHLEHRVLLSGTPLQNNVNELFSLLNFLEPSQFASSEAFLTEFGQLKSESEVMKLQALLKPMMLRRLKEDVEKSLAPKEETVVEVELTNIQKKYYRGILERNFSFLAKGTTSAANIPNLMNTMMELRKCCIHPYLLNGAEDQIQLDYKQTYGEDNESYHKALIQSSGKMVLIDKLLPKLKANGHRVLIFSQMVRCLDILEDYLMYRKYTFERIDGRIRGNMRQEAIDRFSKPDSDRFVFLLCTKAGGLGINLTAADTVIIYDSDWNPQNDLQAQARCHRIGQQKMVKIYRLLCRNTYEREMFDKASLKLGLDKAILQSMNTSQGGKEGNQKQLSKKEIEDLLKKGAYGAVMDDDNAGDKFCEEDIDIILARRTQIIQMESEKGSTFSKASFSSAGIRSDIDIDDPDFWKKWAKKAEIDTTEKEERDELLMNEPRRRTQIKRYGHDDATMEVSDMDSSPDISDDDGEGLGLRNKRRRDKFGRRSKRYNDEYLPKHESGAYSGDEIIYGNWARSECFKVERGLLTFGWGRWVEILGKNQFRRGWSIGDIEDCARIIVLFCLRYYKGDEKIRDFIWDLIQPSENGEVSISRNHSGLHNPVPRGRNAKKKIKSKDGKELRHAYLQKWEDPSHWSSADKYDCDSYLENSYKKHLFRHSNKLLLRVRLMYYIKHEVINDLALQINEGVNASILPMRVPSANDQLPGAWWNLACDISLLVGTYKHGYENYLAMRTDPQLAFLHRIGPPNDKESSTIKNEDLLKSLMEQVNEGDDTPLSSPNLSPAPGDHDDSTQGSGGTSSHAALSGQWPSMQDLNSRLRRLITSYQRNYKKEELRMQQRAKMDQYARDKERDEIQWRWSKVEEDAFARVVSSYGVEFDPITKSIRWGRFKALARLEKSDEALTDYLKAFMVMCKRQCGLMINEEEMPMHDLTAESIGEDRAITTLERIDLLRVLREEILNHPLLESRIMLCETNDDSPPWWLPGPHDKLLVSGVCKHGIGDSYHKLFCDPKLPYADAAKKWCETKTKAASTSKTPSVTQENDNNESTQEDSEKLSSRDSENSDKKTDMEDENSPAPTELETLTKISKLKTETKVDEPPAAINWFSDNALETRLHHIAHVVQHNEWAITNRTDISMHDISSLRPNPTPSPAPSISSTASPRTPQSYQSPFASSSHAHLYSKHKKHIAIDVETERAKLHALLNTPPIVSSSGLLKASNWERDDSSDSSRRSTPAPLPPPPPAHQRTSIVRPPTPSHPSIGPVDLSAPLDLSEVQDFSMAKKSTSNMSAPQNKGKLDDTLSKLMKRKNVPEPEHIIGKEKKRRKLDEIVLGLSAAKSGGTSVTPASSETQKKSPVIANVTLTPAAPPSSSPAPTSSQKPFSITVTSVPSSSAQKELSNFLSHSIDQQNALLKQQKTTLSIPSSSSSQRKTYESMLADMNKAADLSAKVNAYSQEAKVNKWLAEQSSVAGVSDALADYMAQRRRRRVEPTLDLKRLTGDEHVPVVHRLTGKRLSGPKAPQLKHLTQWISENPMYDMDPKWTESVKESVKLSQESRPPRASSTAPSSSTPERKKGRPPIIDSGNNVPTSLASNLAFSGLSASNLAGLNSSLLSGLSGLGGFDPKTLASNLSSLANFDPKSLGPFDPKLLASLGSYDPKINPLLMGGMSNMLNSMTSNNMIANLAALGIPAFPGMDMSALGGTSGNEGASTSSNKLKNRKSSDMHMSSSKSSASSSNSQFPFLFPNPGLLYPPLGLGGLNPFGVQSGISSAYDALTQCGLLNGGLGVSTSTATSSSNSQSTSRSSGKASTSRAPTPSTSTTSSRHQKSSLDRQQAQLQHLLLPHDTYLLESLSKASAYENSMKNAEKRAREADRRDTVELTKVEKRKSSDTPRSQIPPEFTAVQEQLLKSAKGDKKESDISKMLYEQMASGALSASLVNPGPSKRKDMEKDSFEKLSKTSAEFIARSLEDQRPAPSGVKRSREQSAEPENLIIPTPVESPDRKKSESDKSETQPSDLQDNSTNGMDLEDLIAPSTVVRGGGMVIEEEKPEPSPPSVAVSLTSKSETTEEEVTHKSSEEEDMSKTEHPESSQTSDSNPDNSEASKKGPGRKPRGKKSRDEIEQPSERKRELRSSAGRQAAAAAARLAAAARQEQRQEQNPPAAPPP